MSPPTIYRKISVDPKNEVKMVDALRNTHQTFKAVSDTEYYISQTQCDLLTRKKIPYKKVPYKKPTPK